MVQVPDSLVWEVVKSNNSFMKKLNGRTRRSGAVRFSVESGNLKNISSYKYSGICNSKTVDVNTTETGGAALKLKVASKAATSPAKGVATIPLNKYYRRTQHTIASNATDNYYRRDLKADALKRYSAVYRSNRIQKGLMKKVPVKKGRNARS
mmetsp:Transcript_2848/g.4349  ORF Transcript_2848/g.4349 Transcript_2848/m.4349 type:complete len:152 (+) Transcript_2848:62-517(+)|eukprot:CAMPEP_0195527960 /NCGR_PEP_ID=MMETSP0794_2-20130614/29907_1 /TAXON_ID=515487 /ORGANISM="Stephanopyxis turris, Strain CCMP 815" /LENGTH=151 /DNA_ID=CAMNT_0040658987 /DNA_START=58 /DNA_END=516 /DNA_ORIENTATION=+